MADARALALTLARIATTAGLAYMGGGLWATRHTDRTPEDVNFSVWHIREGLRSIGGHMLAVTDPQTYLITGRCGAILFKGKVKVLFTTSNHVIFNVDYHR